VARAAESYVITSPIVSQGEMVVALQETDKRPRHAEEVELLQFIEHKPTPSHQHCPTRDTTHVHRECVRPSWQRIDPLIGDDITQPYNAR